MRIFSVMALLTLMAGCVSDASMPPSARLVPKTQEAVHSYSFLSCSAKIGASEEGRIRAFLTPLGLTAQDTLVVSVPKNRLPRRDPERINTLNRIFSAYPARVRYVQDTDLRQLPQSEPRGIIRVVRVRGVGVACTRSRPDLGCDTASNLAAMIGYPADTFMPGQGARHMPQQSKVAGSLAGATAAAANTATSNTATSNTGAYNSSAASTPVAAGATGAKP